MRNSCKAQKLISRYAKAYYAIYKGQISFKERNALVAISELLAKAKFFLTLIENTLKSYTDLKVSVMKDFFKAHDIQLSFDMLIKLLLIHNRLILLPEILKQIAMLYDGENAITEFQIITPMPISENFKTKICSFLSGMTKKTVIPHYQIDRSLIGGFRAQSKEFLYENSLRKKLHILTHLID